MGSQQFCLKWNNHQMNLLAVFDQLLQNEAFVDVTLACEGVSLKAHKMVLSACSPYFQTLFLDNPCKHPIVILNSMRYIDLKAIIDFMYKGEVNVSQDQLSALLKTAEMLKVKGLAEVTNQTKQNIVAGGAMPPLSASPPLPHVGQRSPPHIRTSLSPPPKRKKLRTSAMSSAASSPQTPTMSSSIPASSVTDSSQPVLDPKIVSQTSLADLSQDGHSDPDGLSRHSSAEQNNDSVPDLRLEPTLEIKEDHSPSTSNMASDMSYDALPPDLSNTDHPGMDTSSLSAGPSTSGIQSQSSDVSPSQHGLGRKYRKWSEQDMEAAMQDVVSHSSTILGASLEHKVPLSTLHYRLKAINFKTIGTSKLTLTIGEDAELVGMLKADVHRDMPITRSVVVTYLVHVLRKGSDSRRLLKAYKPKVVDMWLSEFRATHPDLPIMKTE